MHFIEHHPQAEQEAPASVDDQKAAELKVLTAADSTTPAPTHHMPHRLKPMIHH